MTDDLRRRWPRLLDESLRMLLRVALLTLLILIVFPHLPGVRFFGSARVAIALAVVFAVLGRLGHSKLEASSVNPDTGAVVSRSRSMQLLTARRWGWLVVIAVWVAAFVVIPSLLLRLLARVPAVRMEFRGWWSTLLPALLFLLVHVLALSTMTRRDRSRSP